MNDAIPQDQQRCFANLDVLRRELEEMWSGRTRPTARNGNSGEKSRDRCWSSEGNEEGPTVPSLDSGRR